MRRLWLGMVAALMVAALPAAAHVPRSAAAPAATLVVDAPPAVTTLTIEDDGTQNNGVFRITGDDGFSPMTVSGYANVVVRAGSGDEFITLDTVDPADPDGVLGPLEALTSITIDGDNSAGNDAGADEVFIHSLPATVAATVLGGDGSDSVSLRRSPFNTPDRIDPRSRPLLRPRHEQLLRLCLRQGRQQRLGLHLLHRRRHLRRSRLARSSWSNTRALPPRS